MIYHCDALKPTAERYASETFRRYARWFRPTRLSWDEAFALVVFVETVGRKAARYIFHWGQAGVKAYARLAQHMLAYEEVQAGLLANQASLGPDDGLAVLVAMRDGGWERNHLPNVVRMTLKHLRERHTLPEIARLTGLSVDQVEYATNPRRKSRRAAAYAAIAVAG